MGTEQGVPRVCAGVCVLVCVLVCTHMCESRWGLPGGTPPPSLTSPFSSWAPGSLFPVSGRCTFWGPHLGARRGAAAWPSWPQGILPAPFSTKCLALPSCKMG